MVSDVTEAKPLDLEGIKEKIIEDCRKENFTTESYPAIHFIIDTTIKEIEQRIKSAVKGLIKEIREETYDRESGKEVSDVLPVIYPVVDLDDIINLIEKWFPDVVEDEQD